jgi:hypothetical protein
MYRAGVTPGLSNALRTAATSVLPSNLAASTGATLQWGNSLSMVASTSRASLAATLLPNGISLPDVASKANVLPEELHRSQRVAPGHPAVMSRPSPLTPLRSLSSSMSNWSSSMAWTMARCASKNALASLKVHLFRTHNVVAQRMLPLFYQLHQRANPPAALVSTALASTARAAALPQLMPLPHQCLIRRHLLFQPPPHL